VRSVHTIVPTRLHVNEVHKEPEANIPGCHIEPTLIVSASEITDVERNILHTARDTGKVRANFQVLLVVKSDSMGG
jgi:hypothetical protein